MRCAMDPVPSVDRTVQPYSNGRTEWYLLTIRVRCHAFELHPLLINPSPHRLLRLTLVGSAGHCFQQPMTVTPAQIESPLALCDSYHSASLASGMIIAVEALL